MRVVGGFKTGQVVEGIIGKQRVSGKVNVN